jgi:hypothetical protein
VDAFRAGLQTLGYSEGQNVAIDFRWTEGQYDRLPALAAELMMRPVVRAGNHMPIPWKRVAWFASFAVAVLSVLWTRSADYGWPATLAVAISDLACLAIYSLCAAFALGAPAKPMGLRTRSLMQLRGCRGAG